MTRVAQQRVPLSIRNSQIVVLAGMALGLALFYWGGTLPPRGLPALLGLLIFGALALLRPDLGLLFVLFTVPLYLIPASLPGLRASGFALPLHEAALLAVFGATAAGWGWRRVTENREPRTKNQEPRTENRRTGEPENRRSGEPKAEGSIENRSAAITTVLWRYAPHLLFLLAGGLGVALAVERGPALIEFRRLIIEPLIFYALITFHSRRAAHNGESGFQPQLLSVFVLSGALVALLGLLQYVGLDLVPLLGKKDCFCQNIVLDGGARRVASVYGHPNNLGLYLGRVWPIAAALGIAGLRAKNREPRTAEPQNRRTAEPQNQASAFGSWFLVLGSLLCLGGIVVSFSRGAWLGAIAALAVLALPWLRARFGGRLAPELVACGVALAALVGLALTLRGDVTGGSTPVRLLLWREALEYIRLHPLGIGLDQFVYYHDPKSGLSLIDPSLIGTSDEFAAHPHNLLLDTWLRLGPLGLIAFGWLLARFLRASRQRANDPLVLGVLAAMVAALVHGLVDNFYFVPDLALVFWLLIILMEVVGRPVVDSV